MKNLISIIVPTYKEADNIPVLIESIDKAVKPHRLDYEVIIVDDNSKDGIEDKVKELKKKGFPVSIKVRINERGLSSAVIEGFRLAQGTIYLVMDADLSHPPEKIPEIVAPIIEGKAEFVIGSRFVEGGSAEHFNWYRKLNAWVSKMLARPFTKVKDPMAGFFAFNAKILTPEILNILNPLGFKIGLEIIVKCNPNKIIEIPISFKERLFGESKLSFREQLLYLLHLKRLFHYKYPSMYQFLFFSLIGSTGMIVDMTTVFITYGLLHINFKIARAIAFIVALTWNFFLNRKLTFPDSPHKNLLIQYRNFFIVCSIGGLFNWFISVYLYSTYPYFKEFYLLAVFIGIMGGLVINFLGSKYIVFGK
ncbi:MAG: glycosyltransferase family 2 protein [Spirochaetes bacterium]|nr:glycosyltransferase family 2 protein [Spirochaetota bacterium]